MITSTGMMQPAAKKKLEVVAKKESKATESQNIWLGKMRMVTKRKVNFNSIP